MICSCSNYLTYMESFEYQSILVDSGSIVHCWAAQERLCAGKHTSSCSSDLSTNRDDVRRRRSLEEPGFLKMEAQGQGQAACFFCPASRLVDGFYILTKATAYRYAKPKRGSEINTSYQNKSIHILPCKTDGKLRLQHPC